MQGKLKEKIFFIFRKIKNFPVITKLVLLLLFFCILFLTIVHILKFDINNEKAKKIVLKDLMDSGKLTKEGNHFILNDQMFLRHRKKEYNCELINLNLPFKIKFYEIEISVDKEILSKIEKLNGYMWKGSVDVKARYAKGIWVDDTLENMPYSCVTTKYYVSKYHQFLQHTEKKFSLVDWDEYYAKSKSGAYKYEPINLASYYLDKKKIQTESILPVYNWNISNVNF